MLKLFRGLHFTASYLAAMEAASMPRRQNKTKRHKPTKILLLTATAHSEMICRLA